MESRGTQFPEPKYCRRPTLICSDNSPQWGVLLAGDSLHAFPSDFGQGVNAGLADVDALIELMPNGSIQSEKNYSKLKQALKKYEADRVTEAQALCELFPYGFPHQYRGGLKNLKFLRQCGKFCNIMRILSALLWSIAIPSKFLAPKPVLLRLFEEPPIRYTVLRDAEIRRKRIWYILFITLALIFSSLLLL